MEEKEISTYRKTNILSHYGKYILLDGRYAIRLSHIETWEVTTCKRETPNGLYYYPVLLLTTITNQKYLIYRWQFGRSKECNAQDDGETILKDILAYEEDLLRKEFKNKGE